MRRAGIIGGDLSPLMPRSSPHFFKVFLPDLSSQRLKIPSAFQHYLGSESLGLVSLKGPSGRIWHVELVESSKGFHFESGWKEFVSDHSVVTGDFLVFRYDGCSLFSVMVFDATACEKESAFLGGRLLGDKSAIIDRKELEEEEEEEKQGDPMVEDTSKALILCPRGTIEMKLKRDRVMNDCLTTDIPPLKKIYSPLKSTGTKCPTTCLDSSKKTKSMISLLGGEGCRSSCCGPLALVDDDSFVTPRLLNNTSSAYSKKPCKDAVHFKTPRPHYFSEKLVTFTKSITSKTSANSSGSLKLLKYGHVRRRGEAVAKIQRMPSLMSQRRPVTQEEIDKALKRAKLFKSKFPSTLVVMQDSYVYISFFLHIPSSFAREHLPKISRKVTIWDPQGTPWAVTYVSYGSYGAFSGGWGTFSFGNNLEKFDVCVFELIKKNHLKVHIFRVVEQITPLIRSSSMRG